MGLYDQDGSKDVFNLAALRDYAYRKLSAEHWEELNRITSDIRAAKEKETRAHFTDYQKRIKAEIHRLTKEGTNPGRHLRPSHIRSPDQMSEIKRMAKVNVDAMHKGTIQDLVKEEKNKIRTLLKQAKPMEEGLTPKFNTTNNPTQTRTRRRSR